MDPTLEPFEKQVESTPLSRNFGELQRSQTAKAHHMAEEAENLDTDFVSLIVENNNYVFYMGNLATPFSGELPPEPRIVAEALKCPNAPKWKEVMDTEMHTMME